MNLTDVIKRHSERVGIYYSGDDAERVNSLLERYHEISTESLREQKQFNDDLLVWLRALALTLDMTANASTHGEKNARLRGAIELIESAVGRVRDHSFGVQFCQRRFHTVADVFRSDYPTRHLLDRIHALEAELAALKPKPGNEPMPDMAEVDRNEKEQSERRTGSRNGTY